jgi:hypothetical protein
VAAIGKGTPRWLVGCHGAKQQVKVAVNKYGVEQTTITPNSKLTCRLTRRDSEVRRTVIRMAGQVHQLVTLSEQSWYLADALPLG